MRKETFWEERRRGSNNATSGCSGRSLHTLRSVTHKLQGYTTTNQEFILWRLEMTMGPVCAFPPFLLSSKIKSCLHVLALFTTAVPLLLIDSLNPNSQSKGAHPSTPNFPEKPSALTVFPTSPDEPAVRPDHLSHIL